MPTKNKAAVVADLSIFKGNGPYRVASLLDAFPKAYNAIGFGTQSRRSIWLKMFDPATPDLSKLPIRILDLKALRMPRKFIPSSQEGLAVHCGWLIDAGRDAVHIEAMTSSAAWDVSLDEHAEALWSIRDHHVRIFEMIVTGRFGRALVELEKRKITALGRNVIERIIARHMLLWCAFDVQLIAARARASMVAPLGPFFRVASGVMEFKAGRVLKVMEGIRRALDKCFDLYKPSDAGLSRLEESRAETLLKKHRAAVPLRDRALTAQDQKGLLDVIVAHLKSHLPAMDKMLELLRSYQSESEADGGRANRENRLLNFHPLWFSGLTHTEGLAVAMLRYTMAERAVVPMLAEGRNFIKKEGRLRSAMAPVPALQSAGEMADPLVRRALELVDSARRCQLRDSNWRSRDRKGRPIDIWLAQDEAHSMHHVDGNVGVKFMRRAVGFVKDMGQREWDAYAPRWSHDHRHFTYWHMDVIPERRLCQ